MKKLSNNLTQKTKYFNPQKYAEITEKRNRQMRDNINKAARFLINWCLKYQVGSIVFGWNQGNKDSINIGKKNNQEFVQIPTARLKNRIAQLFWQYGINFVEVVTPEGLKARIRNEVLQECLTL